MFNRNLRLSPQLVSVLPLLILAAALVVSNVRLLFGDAFYWGLPTLQFVPWRELAWSLVRGGELPLWNIYNGGGAPLFANYQSALLYPFSWLTFFLPVAWSMSVLAVFHLFIAGWGMWRLAGALGAGVLGRGMAALAFGLTQYLVARLGTYPTISAAAWLPWLLWAIWGMARGERRLEWLALFAALQLLAGHAQTTWYSLLLCAIWGGFLLLLLPMTGRQRVMRALGMAGGVLLAVGVAALQLWATAELLANSQREGGVGYEFAMNFSYHPLRLLNLLAPNIFGTPADGSYFTQGAYFEDAVYIGLIPLFSAIAAVVLWIRTFVVRRRTAPFNGDAPQSPTPVPQPLSLVPFWFAIVLIGAVFAFGQFSPVFPFLYERVPTFDLFQAPVRWHLWTVCGLSVLAAMGAGAWSRSASAKRWARRGLVAAVALLLLVLARNLLPGGATVQTLLAGIGQPALLIGAAAWLTLRQPLQDRPEYARWSMLVLLIIAADLVWASRGLNPTVVASAFAPGRASTTVRTYLTSAQEQAVKFEQYFRFQDYQPVTQSAEMDISSVRSAFLPNVNLLNRAYMFNNFDPLLTTGYTSIVQLLEAGAVGVYAAAGVQLPEALRLQPERQTLAVVSAVIEGGRAWTTNVVCWHADESSLIQAMRDPTWQPLRLTHLRGEGTCVQSTEVSFDNYIRVFTQEQRATVQTYTFDMPQQGYLVTPDMDYPGWQATVDGVPVPVVRANLAFRAVQVPPGQHTMTFAYQPSWLLPGALISAGATLVLVLLFASAAVQSRRRVVNSAKPL